MTESGSAQFIPRGASTVTAMVQQNTAKKKHGPPKFPHLPKARAKKLKSAWIKTRKIKSKWNAEKRGDGVGMKSSPTAPALETTVPNVSDIPAGDTLNHRSQLINTGSDISPSKSDERPVNAPSVKEPVRTAKTGLAVGSSKQKDRRLGRHGGYQGKRPSMRNRMNALLEKIQKEID